MAQHSKKAITMEGEKKPKHKSTLSLKDTLHYLKVLREVEYLYNKLKNKWE